MIEKDKVYDKSCKDCCKSMIGICNKHLIEDTKPTTHELLIQILEEIKKLRRGF